VRNAVDHGIEASAARVASGKSEQGRLRLSSARVGDEVLVSIEDDGAGIDWDRLAEAARRRGLNADSHDERVAALLADGVTTRHEVSGRGVGMGSLAHEVRALGGRLEVESQRGRGTTFKLWLPWRALQGPMPGVLAAA
jgi:two-component system, chemotaxis family, sensor kinase CheA